MTAINSDCDLIVELIGGTSVSYNVVKEALKRRNLSLLNKALIAEHGDELFQLSMENETYLGYEASVAGAIPVINTLSHNMSNEKILSISGIINGTCNYILDQMSSENKSFDESLESAKKLGYAESDPTFDIGGFDAAHRYRFFR